MEAKTDTRRHLGAHAWREVFRRFESGGDSVVAFCKREGLNTSSFHRWRRRLATTTTKSSAAQDPREPTRRSEAASFIEMGSMARATSAAAARLEVRLELGNGMVLHLMRG